MPAADCEERSFRIWGSLTMEEPATVAMPRVLLMVSLRHLVSWMSMSRISDL